MKKKIAVFGSGWAYEFITSILNGIKEATSSYNADIYYFTCYKFHNPDKSINCNGYRFFDFVPLEEFDGIILLSNLFETDEALIELSNKIKQTGIPVVSLIKPVEGISSIVVDNYYGYYNLIKHLIEKHNVSNLAFIGGIKNDTQSEERYRAFLQALQDFNIPINKDLIISNTDWSFKSGYENGLKLLKDEKNRPDAIICSNDTLAYGITRAAYEYNISIPEDIKLIGFDNDSFSENSIPSISTVNPKSKELGKKAIELLFSKEKEVQNISISSEPIIRQSCGCNLDYTKAQLSYSIKSMYTIDEDERFLTHLRHTEDVFINEKDIATFWENCQTFFEKRHQFEGENFAILLKSSLIDSIFSEDITYNDADKDIDMGILVYLKDGKKQKPFLLKKKELFPSDLLSKQNTIFFFIPLVYRNNFYGYYFTKDNLKLLENKRGYTWSKNISNSIEKFREKNKYYLLSKKYMGLSTTDPLSGIYNRAGLNIFGNDLYKSNRENNLFTLISFLDVNYLKVINDKYGHLHGDFVIKIIAEEIKKIIPEKWVPIRYGGDEFVIIGFSKSTDNNKYIDDLNDNLKIKKQEMSLPYDLSVSIGSIIVPPDSSKTLEKEISKADEIMYINKKLFHETHDK